MDNLTFPETAQKLGTVSLTRYLTESFIVFLENLNENNIKCEINVLVNVALLLIIKTKINLRRLRRLSSR
jgi:hypothetical protein